MASCYTTSTSKPMMLLLFPLAMFVCLQCFPVASFEYQVGGERGWVVPPSNDTRIYNDWASENRFIVGDTVYFKYKKDSVMEVREEDYKRCNSSHPKFFSNSGNTIYKLNHQGPYYFMSGAAGHCEKGQKMIIKVMTHEGDDDTPSHGGGGDKKSAGSPGPVTSFGVTKLGLLLFFVFYVASFVCY